MRLSYIVGPLVGLFAFLALAFSLSGTIDQGERGVLLRNGAISEVLDPGRYYKLPIIDSVRPIEVTQQTVRWTGDQHLEAYSKDQQSASIALSVSYHVPADHETIKEVYSQYGSRQNLEARLINRLVTQQFKTVFGKFTAQSAIQQREVLNAEVQRTIQDTVKGPVVIDSVQVEDISFSDAYENAIEARMTAEVEVQRIEQNARKEKVTAEITVIQAEAQADAKLAQARAEAESIRIQGEATASAIKARGDALRANPDLVRLTAAEKWNGQLPQSMIPQGAVPFVDVK